MINDEDKISMASMTIIDQPVTNKRYKNFYKILFWGFICNLLGLNQR